MNRALIIGASGGIGSAVADALRAQRCEVTGLSRSGDGLDVTVEASVDAALAPISGPFDMIFVASGALEINGNTPEKSIKALSSQAMAEQFALNAIGPALIMRHAARLLPRNNRCVFAVLSARVGSIDDNRMGGWISYRAAKAAANQIVRTGAIELARTHPQAICVCLHPGTVQTAFTKNYLGRYPSVSPEEAAQNLMNVISSLKPEHNGMFFDWAGEVVPW